MDINYAMGLATVALCWAAWNVGVSIADKRSSRKLRDEEWRSKVESEIDWLGIEVHGYASFDYRKSLTKGDGKSAFDQIRELRAKVADHPRRRSTDKQKGAK